MSDILDIDKDCNLTSHTLQRYVELNNEYCRLREIYVNSPHINNKLFRIFYEENKHEISYAFRKLSYSEIHHATIVIRYYNTIMTTLQEGKFCSFNDNYSTYWTLSVINDLVDIFSNLGYITCCSLREKGYNLLVDAKTNP